MHAKPAISRLTGRDLDAKRCAHHITHRSDVANRFCKVAATILIASTLGACTMSKTIALDDDPDVITASSAKPAKAEGIDSTDAEMIKTVVVEAESAKPAPHALAWANPDTGNHGTIMAIDKFTGSHGQKCKKFQTTVDSFMGISIYNGETCELRRGFWVLSWFMQDKS